MKLNNSNIIIVSLLVFLIFQSCTKTNYNKLNDDEIKWLVYMKDDLIIFATPGAPKDTYYVSIRNRAYTIDKPNYNEFAGVGFYKYSDTVNANNAGNISIKKDNGGGLEASYVFPHFPNKVILTDMVPVPVDTINGVPVENVYISESDSSTYSLINHIRKVYYTKEDGFIKLEDIYGNTWYKIN